METTDCNPCSFQVQLDSNSLFQVFSLLDIKDKRNVAQVCQHWRDVASLPSLWRNVSVVLHNNLGVSLVRSLYQRKITRFVCHGSTEEDLSLLFQTNPIITSLHINACRHVSQTFLETNLMKLENLVSLHVTECRQINLNSLYHKKSLKGVLSNLKSFTLPVVARIQGYSSFESILKRYPRLEEVGYDGDLPLRFFTCPAMILARLCPNLQRLKLGPEWVKKKNVWRDVLEVLDVKALDLDMRPLHPPGLGPSVEENIMYIADVLPKLERLNLFCKGRISVDGIITLVKKLKNLKHFDLSQVYFPFDCDRKKIFYEFSKMSQLETLKLDLPESITAELVYTLVEGLPNLKHLELGDVGSISPEYADLIGGQLQKLRSFKVTVSPYGGSGIGALCGKLPNLTDLTIKHGGLTNGGLIQMSSGVTQSQLKSLNVAGSQKINDQGITCIANTFKSLTCLDITSCSVSDSGLAVIAEQMNQLERLSVTGRKVTNYGGVMIGKHLIRLEHLKISGTKIGDQGFALSATSYNVFTHFKHFVTW